MHDQPGHVQGLEQQIGTERGFQRADPDVLADLVVARRVPAPLVELPVGRQIRLGRHPEQFAAVDHDRAVVEAVAVTKGRTDDEHGKQVLGGLDQALDRRYDRVEHGILQNKVVDRIPGEAQLGEDRDRDRVTVARLGGLENGLRVRRRVGDRDRDRARRDAGEPVAVRALEREAHGPSLSASTSRSHGARPAVRTRPYDRGDEREPLRYIPAEARVVWSASDLKAAAECEFAWLRGIDARIGRITAVEEPEDATLERAGRLGGEHELRVLAGYRATYGDGVVEIAETSSANAEGLAEAVARTREALTSDADVIYQAAFATHEFVGFADFLVRDEVGRWIVQDSKLARRARVTALMQLSAYVDQLDRLGVARSDRVELLLGDGTVSVHIADELLPVFALRRARLRALIDDRRLDLGLAWPAIAWGDPRGDLGVVACGRCATCDSEVVAARDLLLVAGMRPVQRDRLRTSGITTIDQLARTPTAPSRMNPDTFGMLRTQSRLQLSAPAGTGAAVASHESHPPMPPFEVVAPKALGALPRPDAGDLFFDFEGDPLYTEGDATVWGIDYLFGWVDIREQYSALWAHSFDEERAALEAFLDFVQVHRSRHPDFHIYHYAPYEPTHLLTMAARHGTREADVDRLLRDGVFVDLYPIVRRSLRIGSRSYSIKKLEPLYMGDEVRTSDVQKGDESIVKYVEARALRDDGDTATAQEIFADLADYNRYDCVSTRRLRDWLVDRARDAGLRPLPNPEPGENVYEPSARALALSALALQHAEDSAEAMALRLGAAGIDYYAREAKSFWATHYLRLREPVSLWEETRDVVSLDSTLCRLVEDWHRPEGARTDRRILELRGELAPGTRLSEGSNPFALYELPAPFPFEPSPRWIHADHRVTVIEVLDDGAIVEENAVGDVTWTQLPVALTPSAAAPRPEPAGGDRRVGGCRHRSVPRASRRPGHRHPAPARAAHP